jgi:hypothetical protein
MQTSNKPIPDRNHRNWLYPIETNSFNRLTELKENKAFNFISLNKLDTTKSIFVANDSGQKIDVSGQAGFFLYQPGKNKADFSGRLKA